MTAKLFLGCIINDTTIWNIEIRSDEFITKWPLLIYYGSSEERKVIYTGGIPWRYDWLLWHQRSWGFQLKRGEEKEKFFENFIVFPAELESGTNSHSLLFLNLKFGSKLAGTSFTLLSKSLFWFFVRFHNITASTELRCWMKKCGFFIRGRAKF